MKENENLLQSVAIMNYKQTDFSKFGEDCFPGLLGIEVLNVSTNLATAQNGNQAIAFCSKRLLTCRKCN